MHIINRTVLGLLVLSVALVVSPSVQAAQLIDVYIEGATQGHIQGDGTRPSHEDWIDAIEYHHLVSLPEGSSRLDHETIIFTKKIDRATPSLWRAMDNNEMLVEVKFHFWRPYGGGGEENHYRVVLAQARIVAIEPLSPRNDIAETAGISMTERIRISYATMTVTWVDDGNEHTLTVDQH